MGFKNDFSQAQQNSSLKPAGDYEVIVVKAEERTTQNGKTGLNLSMVIRNDVEQGYKNGYIFHTLWKRREPTAADMQVNGYGFGQIMALGKAAQLPDGKDYADLGEFLADVMNKPLRVRLKHETYNGTEHEAVDYINPTNYPQVRHEFKKQVTAGTYAAPQINYATQAAQAASTGYTNMPPLDRDLPF